MLGDNSERDPPEPIPNSEVKPLSANDSVGFPHVKVGHCQAPVYKRSFAFFYKAAVLQQLGGSS